MDVVLVVMNVHTPVKGTVPIPVILGVSTTTMTSRTRKNSHRTTRCFTLE